MAQQHTVVAAVKVLLVVVISTSSLRGSADQVRTWHGVYETNVMHCSCNSAVTSMVLEQELTLQSHVFGISKVCSNCQLSTELTNELNRSTDLNETAAYYKHIQMTRIADYSHSHTAS
jgi:hypothetical protein